MNKQEQIDALQFRIERIEAKLAEQHISNNFSKLNRSEKPNSCEPDYTHLLPEGYEFCTEQDAEKWVKVEMSTDIPELKKVGYIWNNPTIPSTKRYRPVRKIKPDYTHLLPSGYEFCEEGEHENWVKVKMRPDSINPRQIGGLSSGICIPDFWKPYYRPIRPIQYHVAIHESVTAEPDPYQVDWSNAPNWADVHCFDKNGKGNWYGVKRDEIEWYRCNIGNSEFTLPSGLDWKQSKRLNPKLK
jgi:hypothetical protein